MADCTFCKRPAGFLRSNHRACKQAHDVGTRAIVKWVNRADLSPEQAAEEILRTAEEAHVTETLKQALADGWAMNIEAALAKGGVDDAEEARLDALLACFNYSRNDVDPGHVWRRVEAKRAQAAGEQVERLIEKAVDSGDPSEEALAEVQAAIAAAARSARLGEADVRRVAIAAVEKAIESALEDKSLTEAKESALLKVFTHFRIGQEDLDGNGAYTRLVQAGILRDVAEGETRQRIHLEMPDLTFRMQKSETLLWVYPNVDYYTVRARRELEGRVYLLSGRFRADPVQDEETVLVDSGVFGITTRHVYFAGASERFRIGHDRIVTVEPYSGPAGMVQGVTIVRDSAGARLETFLLGDGSFAYKLLRDIEAP